MTTLPLWVKLPTHWIEAQGLRQFRWTAAKGSNNLAALMTLMAISHHADLESGVGRLTYDELQSITMLSRAKIAAGLDVLEARAILERGFGRRSTFRLADYNPAGGWAMLPARPLYRHGSIAAFAEFRLRLPAELDAMKLYFLFVSRRDHTYNHARISYEKIEEYSGINRDNIRRGLTFLGALGLVHIEHIQSSIAEEGYANAYRLTHLNSRRHMGTTGRGQINLDPPFDL